MTGETLKELFDRYYEDVRRYVFYRGGDAGIADEVAQQAFIRIWEKKQLLIPGKEKALLYKIAGDIFVDTMRKNSRQVDFNKDFELRSDYRTVEDDLQFKELAESFKKSLAKMKEKERIVFLMSRNDGMKYNEIASALSLSVKAIEKRMKGALDFLRKELKYQ